MAAENNHQDREVLVSLLQLIQDDFRGIMRALKKHAQGEPGADLAATLDVVRRNLNGILLTLDKLINKTRSGTTASRS